MTFQAMKDILECMLAEHGITDIVLDSEGEDDNKNSTKEDVEPVGPHGIPEKKQGEYTLEDYYAIPDDYRVELIDGTIYDMTTPRPIHQRLIGWMSYQIEYYLRRRDEGKECHVLISPCDVQLDCDDKTMVQPDLFIICGQDKLKGFGIYGAPEYILEVLSKSTRKKDMYRKLEKYAGAGVREYWMIDIENRKLIVYNFMTEDSIPEVLPLEGKKGLAIFNGECEIDLDRLQKEIERFNFDD